MRTGIGRELLLARMTLHSQGRDCWRHLKLLLEDALEVPGNDIGKYDIIIEQQDSCPLPSFPENRQKAEIR